MEFSRAVLAASASVLGLLLYFVAGLLIVLTLANLVRADAAGAPPGATLAAAAAFAAGGAALRFIARRFA